MYSGGNALAPLELMWFSDFLVVVSGLAGGRDEVWFCRFIQRNQVAKIRLGRVSKEYQRSQQRVTPVTAFA
jgi:hypothetical protein